MCVYTFCSLHLCWRCICAVYTFCASSYAEHFCGALFNFAEPFCGALLQSPSSEPFSGALVPCSTVAVLERSYFSFLLSSPGRYLSAFVIHGYLSIRIPVLCAHAVAIYLGELPQYKSRNHLVDKPNSSDIFFFHLFFSSPFFYFGVSHGLQRIQMKRNERWFQCFPSQPRDICWIEFHNVLSAAKSTCPTESAFSCVCAPQDCTSRQWTALESAGKAFCVVPGHKVAILTIHRRTD